MRERTEKVQDSELEILRVFWSAGTPLPLAELCRRLNSACGWADSTVKTLLRRMQDKGLVRLVRRGVYDRRPAAADARRASAQTLAQRGFDCSAKNRVAALVRTGQLSEDDLAELSAMFNAPEEPKP